MGNIFLRLKFLTLPMYCRNPELSSAGKYPMLSSSFLTLSQFLFYPLPADYKDRNGLITYSKRLRRAQG